MQHATECDLPNTQGPARVLLWVGLAMCAMCLAAIGVAETFMPENLAGQKGVITFYRWFGASFLCWGAVVAWTLCRLKSPVDHPT
jgi:hypothetical protein